MMLGSTVSTAPSDTSARFVLRDRMKECIDQDDWRKMQGAFTASDPGAWLASIDVPTLVLQQPGPWSTDAASEVAAEIRGAKLQLLEDHGNMLYSATAEAPPGVKAIVEFVENLAAVPDGSADRRSEGLSTREVEVLRLVATGKTNQEIADALVISLNTVRRHVSNIFDKTGAANRAEATAYAARQGLI
jgi:DNA-binding CsgD family transcriptional regulator